MLGLEVNSTRGRQLPGLPIHQIFIMARSLLQATKHITFTLTAIHPLLLSSWRG